MHDNVISKGKENNDIHVDNAAQKRKKQTKNDLEGQHIMKKSKEDNFDGWVDKENDYDKKKGS